MLRELTGIKKDMDESFQFLIHVTLLTSCFWKGFSYPEVGCLLRLEESISNQLPFAWTALHGWKDSSATGLFMSDFIVDRNLSEFVVPQSGYYFVSVNIMISTAQAGNVFVKIASRHGLSWKTRAVSKVHAFEGVSSLALVSVQPFSKSEQFCVFAQAASNSWVVQKHSSITIQFIAVTKNLVGFVAAPKFTPISDATYPVYVSSWAQPLQLINGFSIVTGTFISAVDGDYLITLNFVFGHLRGKLSAYLYVDGRETVMADLDVGTKPKDWHTLHTARIVRIGKKSKLELKLSTQTRDGFLSGESSYSAILLAKGSTFLTASSHSRSLNESLARFNVREWKEIQNWDRSDRNNRLDLAGKFQITESGYYFLLLRLCFRVSNHMTLFLGASSAGAVHDDVALSYGLQASPELSNEVHISGVVKLKKGQYVACFIRALGGTVTIHTGGEIFIYPVRFENPHVSIGLYHNGGIPQDRFSNISFQHAHYDSMYVKRESQDLLRAIVSGVYHISVFISVIAPKYSLVQVQIVASSANNTYSEVATGFTDTASTLSIPTVRYLEKNTAIIIRFKCMDTSNCLPSLSSSIGLWLVSKAALIEGFSLVKLLPQRLFPNERLHRLGHWGESARKKTFNATAGFHSSHGIFQAAVEGTYYISAAIILVPESSSISFGEFEVSIVIEEASVNRLKTIRRVVDALERQVSASISVSVKLFRGYRVYIQASNSLNESWVVTQSSYFSVVLISASNERKPPDFLVVKRYNLAKESIISDWFASEQTFRGTAFPAQNEAYNFRHQTGKVLAEEAILALISISVTGRLASESGRTDQAEVMLRRQGLPVSNDMTSRMSTSVIQRQQAMRRFTLQCTAVVLINPNDLLDVWINSSSQFEMEIGMFSVAVLQPIKDRASMVARIGREMAHLTTSGLLSLPLTGFDTWCSSCFSTGVEYSQETGTVHIQVPGWYMVSIQSRLKYHESNDDTRLYINVGRQWVPLKRSIHPETLEEKIEYMSPHLIEKNDAIRLYCLGKHEDVSVTFMDGWFHIITLGDGANQGVSLGSSRSAEIRKPGVYLFVISPDAQNTGQPVEVVLENKNTDEEIWRFKDEEIDREYKQTYIKELVESTKLYLNSKKPFVQDSSSIQVFSYETSKRSDLMSARLLYDQDVCGRFGRDGGGIEKDSVKWVVSDGWYDEQSGDDRSGFFTVGKQGEYILSVTILSSSSSEKLRKLQVVLDGNFVADSIIDLSKEAGLSSAVVHSASRLVRLAAHQAVYLTFGCRNNQTFILAKGSTIQLLRNDDILPHMDDDFPVFHVHPFPPFLNTSNETSWTCGAIGPDSISYHWNKIDAHSRLRTVVSNSTNLTLKGMPEESGLYFCLAHSDGFESESRPFTLDISDTDECKDNTTGLDYFIPCHAMAECVNTIGSYYCNCRPGFIGNGYHCSDMNECELDELNDCNASAACINFPGGYNCSCHSGFEGDGFNCTDIDECKSFPCWPHSVCMNLLGFYQCNCIEGYSGVGFCADIDECTAEVIPCDHHATCTNQVGSYICVCDPGWTGNGSICTDIDECLHQSCASNATCRNMEGSYRCLCDRGFRGDGELHCIQMECIPPPVCAGQFITSWWSRTPYITNTSDGRAQGLFKEILENIISSCCNNCSELVFGPPLNSFTDVEGLVLRNQTDLAFPIYGSKGQSMFRKTPFVPVVESPGVAFFVKDAPPSKSPLLESLSGSWPILVITLLLAALSGVIMWFLDTVRNPKEFPHAFLEGSWEGFWWAFITMTTVGYGDKAPKSLPARLFGIFWILIGLVIISTFTATITTVLTATSLTSESKLYGTKVGALDNSEEYRLGVKRNADVIGYSSVPEVIDALNQGIIQGALIDTYIAGEFQGELSGYRMVQVLEHVFVYGVALSRDATALQKCFDTYIETQQSDLFTTISKVVKLPKEKNSANQHVQSSATLFDSNSPFFKQVVICGACMLAALLLFGFLWDILYWRRKEKILIRIFSKPLDNGAKVENRFKPGAIVEYQRKAFKNDICEIKEQIEQFSACWVKKLDSMDAQFQDQLEQVHQWLEKAVLSQEDTLPSSKDFTHSVSVDHQKQMQKGSFDEMEWDSQGLTVINSTKEVFSLMDKLSEARLTNLWSNGNTQV